MFCRTGADYWTLAIVVWANISRVAARLRCSKWAGCTEQGYPANLGSIHRGFISSVPQKEDQANLPPKARPHCSLEVASQRPINQRSFNLSNRNKAGMLPTSQIDTVIRGKPTAFPLNGLCMHPLPSFAFIQDQGSRCFIHFFFSLRRMPCQSISINKWSIWQDG